MTIDNSGGLWIGTEAGDLDEFLKDATAESYPASRIAHARCVCGGPQFRVQVDDTQGCAKRTCVDCCAEHMMLDSAEFWVDADPGPCACPCGADVFDVAVAFSQRSDESLQWVTIGLRCLRCGGLGVYADWKIDYEPTRHLYSAV